MGWLSDVSPSTLALIAFLVAGFFLVGDASSFSSKSAISSIIAAPFQVIGDMLDGASLYGSYGVVTLLVGLLMLYILLKFAVFFLEGFSHYVALLALFILVFFFIL